jgi:putative ABC transport system permease protein
MLFRLILESAAFSWDALRSNLLRTILSLLGVTVGIFAIIAVLTVVDAMESNIRQSLSFLGDRVIYVQKWPWAFGGDYPWWKYYNRPAPRYNEYRFLAANLERQEAVAIFDSHGNVTLRNKNNSLKGAFVQGISSGYESVTQVPLESGRFFTLQEQESGSALAVVGSQIVKTLFPGVSDPTGMAFKIKGLPFIVVGVIQKQGSNLLGVDFDNVAFIPYKTFEKLFSTRLSEPNLAVRGIESDLGMKEIEGEIRGSMRRLRGLRPSQEDNFALNRPEMIASAITSLFGVLNAAGWFIGIFSILVGAFGIANIMFVSVRERTNIIGIQKALGAKNYFILLQFLFEAMFLSLLGGLAGLFLVLLITLIPQDFLALQLTAKNITLGLGVSSVVGILAGIIPAGMAAKMDPVEAIRSK